MFEIKLKIRIHRSPYPMARRTSQGTKLSRKYRNRERKTTQRFDPKIFLRTPTLFPGFFNVRRPQHQPSLGRCDHDGDCEKTCDCVANKTFCQPTCKCYDTCPRKRVACDCKKCDERCLCQIFEHECTSDCTCSNCKNKYDNLKYPSLRVKESKLKNAGKGLFTNQHIAKDALVGEYIGELVDDRYRRSSTDYISRMAVSKSEHTFHNHQEHV